MTSALNSGNTKSCGCLKNDCWAFPSQTYDGKMCVRYTRKAWVETAEEALRLCGVIE